MANSYLILSTRSIDAAWGISAKIWQLVNPDADASQFTTKYWSGVLVHSDGRLALTIPENDEVLVHPEAKVDDLVTAIGSGLTSSGKDKLKSDLESSKGQKVRAMTVLPLEKLGSVKTRDQLRADGWFPAIVSGI